MDVESAILNLRVKPGDAITRDLWNGLLDLCAALASSFGVLKSGSGIRFHSYPQGLNIVADRGSASFIGAFNVRVAGMEATIGFGTVDDIVPAIDDVRLDDKTAPKLKITGEPNDALRSWVAIQATVAGGTDAGSDAIALDPEDPAALQIIHTSDLSLDAEGELLAEGTALRAIAMLIWSDAKTVSRVRQIVYFNQRLTITPATTAVKLTFSAAS